MLARPRAVGAAFGLPIALMGLTGCVTTRETDCERTTMRLRLSDSIQEYSAEFRRADGSPIPGQVISFNLLTDDNKLSAALAGTTGSDGRASPQFEGQDLFVKDFLAALPRATAVEAAFARDPRSGVRPRYCSARDTASLR